MFMNAKLKIGIVYDVIYPYVKGGVEKRNWEIARRLAKRHEVHIFGMKFWEGEDVIRKEGVFLHGVCRPRMLYRNEGRRSIKQALYFSIHLAKPLMKTELDVIDCSNFPYFPLFVCKLKRKPLVATWHEVWGKKYWLEYLGWKGYIGNLVEIISAKLPDKIVSVSEHTQDNLLNVLGRKSEVVHNGISIGDIVRIKAKRDKNRIITVGRLLPFKNVDLIINAMPECLKKNKNAHLVIIGEGPERERLEKLAFGLPVEFKNFVKKHDGLLKEIKSSGVFVTQSSREGFGIIVIEALACGTAVVIPPYLSEFPYAKMCTVADGGQIAKKIFEAKPVARKDVEHFDWDGIAQEMERVYRGVVG